MNRTLVVIGLHVVDRPGLRFLFPITTMLLISGVVALVAWLLRR